MENKSQDSNKMIYLMVHGQPFMVDERHAVESSWLNSLIKGGYDDAMTVKIKSRILIKALDFCKIRGEINLCSLDDDDVRQHKLKDFDSDFLKQNQTDAIALVDVAFKLEIKSLVDVLFEDVVHMIAQKTPEDIEKMFHIRYNGEDNRLMWLNYIMDITSWALK